MLNECDTMKSCMSDRSACPALHRLKIISSFGGSPEESSLGYSFLLQLAGAQLPTLERQTWVPFLAYLLYQHLPVISISLVDVYAFIGVTYLAFSRCTSSDK